MKSSWQVEELPWMIILSNSNLILYVCVFFLVTLPQSKQSQQMAVLPKLYSPGAPLQRVFSPLSVAICMLIGDSL